MAKNIELNDVITNGIISNGEPNGIIGNNELFKDKSYNRLPVEIKFSNITYKVNGGKKTILHGVSGHFRGGQLSVILGTSGAGKSSLMDILLGHKNAGVTGDIQVHGVTSLYKSSCYIQQEEKLQPLLSVAESMHVAAHLKLGTPPSQRYHAVREILETLGLTACTNTRVEDLSGGQRKRLSIALELLSNPPVIFLDEPTTGLDVVSVSHCMKLLRSLALQGRTIVCTLHQPSASLFALFNNIYVLADGRCMYQGAPDQLVPFLASVNLPCPPYNNPTDYVIETTQLSRENVTRLSNAIQNGQRTLPDVIEIKNNTTYMTPSKSIVSFPTSTTTQIVVLIRRMLMQQSRNKTALMIQLMHHLLSAFLIGGLFFQCGKVAEKSYISVQFCVCVMVFYTYTHVMTPVLLFPSELELLKREYYNRWYSLKSYFFASFVARLPAQVFFGFIFFVIAYSLTDQPLEASRIFFFATICLFMVMVSDCLGHVIGATFNITAGSIASPGVVTPLFVLATYGMGYGPVLSSLMKFIMSLSYFRVCLTGMVVSLFGMDREPLVCTELYCHYRRPTTLLYDMGMNDVSIESQMISLIIFFIVYRIFFYIALKIRLTRDLKSSLINFWNKRMLCL